MRRWPPGLDPPEDVTGAVQPRQRLAAMAAFDRVHGRHPGDETADLLMKRSTTHLPGTSKDMTRAWHPGPTPHSPVHA